MSWVHVEAEIELQSDLETLKNVIVQQKKVLNYLYQEESDMERQLRHLQYRRQMERKTNVKVETVGEINAVN